MRKRKKPRKKQAKQVLSGVVRDIVCEWSDSVMIDQRAAVAGIIPDGALLISLLTDKGRRLFSVQLGEMVPSVLGPQRVFLEQIYPGVLKLRPSLLDPEIHAFITIVGAPSMEKNES